MKITAFLKAIEADLKTVPELSGVQDIAVTPGRFNASEISRRSFKSPALRIAFLGAPKTQPKADGTRSYNGAFAIFVLTDGKDRDLECVDLAQAVAEHLELNRFSSDMPVGLPAGLRMDVLYSGEIDNKGLSLYSVSWTQTMRLGESQGLADAEDPTAIMPEGTEPSPTIDITSMPEDV